MRDSSRCGKINREMNRECIIQMAIIINFQEYIKSKNKDEKPIKSNNVSCEKGNIIFLNRKGI